MLLPCSISLLFSGTSTAGIVFAKANCARLSQKKAGRGMPRPAAIVAPAPKTSEWDMMRVEAELLRSLSFW